VPRDLETIILKCLRKEPRDRYGTAEALSQDLRRFVRGDVIEAQKQGTWERAWRRIWRHRLRIALWGLAALLLIVGATLALVLWRRYDEARLARYDELVGAGIDGLEVGLLTSPGEMGEGETIALGIIYPSDVMARSSSRAHWTVEGAAQRLREAASLMPRRPEARVHLSRALYAAGSRLDAEREIEKALEDDPGFLPALLLKGHRLRERKQTEIADALDRILVAAADEPWEEAWLEAHRAAAGGDWDTADRLYTEMIHGEARPFVGFEKELRLKRGRVALKREQYQRALRDFSYARESSRRAPGPTLLLAAACYHADQRSEASEVLAELLSERRTAETAIAVADLHRHFGEIAKARQALKTIEDEATRHAALVDVLLAEGKAAEAVEAGRRALEMGLDEPWVRAAVGGALRGARRMKEARSFLEESLRRFPGDRGIDETYQAVLYYLCAYDELIAHARRNAAGGEGGNTVGWAYYRKGELERAIDVFTKAIEENPRDSRAYLGRSACHSYLHDFDRVPRLPLSLFEGADLLRRGGRGRQRPAGVDGRDLRSHVPLSGRAFAPRAVHRVRKGRDRERAGLRRLRGVPVGRPHRTEQGGPITSGRCAGIRAARGESRRSGSRRASVWR